MLVQWNDELVARDDAPALFDAIASADKRLHVNPGLHNDVPEEEIRTSEAFFEQHLARD